MTQPDSGVATGAALLDAMPMAVVLVDGRRRIHGWNNAAEAFYGHRRGDVLGEPVLDVLFDESDRSVAAALFEGADPGQAWEGSVRVRRNDLAPVVSSFRLAALEGDEAAWIAIDGVDQSLAEGERSVLVRAERAARMETEEARGLLEAVLEAAPIGVAVIDQQLRYVRVNAAYAALSGVSAADQVGAQLGEPVPLPAGVVDDLRQVVTTGSPIVGREVELESNAESGPRRSFTASYFPVRTTTGTLIGAGLALVEVTGMRQAEAERVALLRRAEAAQQRLAILATASTVLTTTMKVDELLARLTRVLTPSAADWCVIELLDANGEVAHVAVSHREEDGAAELAGFLRSTTIDPDGGSPVAEVLRTGRARLERASTLDDLVLGAALERGRAGSRRRFPVRSSAVVPIEHRDQMLGALMLATDGDRGLDGDVLDLAGEIARRAALAVANARAFQQEHQIAESLQRALLPATVPAVPGLELAVRYLAATDGASVGGDWYDVLAFEDGSIGMVVGDVVGHDIAASTAMGQLRSALRIFAWEDPTSPATALARADRLSEHLGLAHATCVIGRLDPSTSSLCWSNAGHPPPLLVRDGSATFLDHETGVLLGVTGDRTCRRPRRSSKRGISWCSTPTGWSSAGGSHSRSASTVLPR